MRLIQRIAEFRPRKQVEQVPRGCRGLYVLYQLNQDTGKKRYDVVYVGMATRGIRGRLRKHLKHKGDHGTHFSAFQVRDNIPDEEIIELEGLFRHLYRKDSQANRLNIQRSFKKAARARQNKLEEWR